MMTRGPFRSRVATSACHIVAPSAIPVGASVRPFQGRSLSGLAFCGAIFVYYYTNYTGGIQKNLQNRPSQIAARTLCEAGQIAYTAGTSAGEEKRIERPEDDEVSGVANNQ